MQKLIELNNGRIEIRFPYTDGMVKRVKMLPLARWDALEKCWWLPKSNITAKLVRHFANECGFTIEGRIVDMAQDANPVHKSDRTALYPYQSQGVDFIHQNGGTCIVADDMGLGKTLEALWYIQESGVHSVLVVCPASVLYKWQAECKRWINREAELVLTSKQKMNSHPIKIMSYGIMTSRSWELTDQVFDLVIFDESHALQSVKSKRTKAAQLVNGRRKMFLTGTPMLNRPIDLYPMLNMVSPIEFGSYWSYVNQYCGAYRQTMGRKQFWVVNGASNTEELKEKLQRFMLRRSKQDVLKQLPPITRSVVPLELSDRREYDFALRDLKTWLQVNGKSNKATALTKLNYLRQIVGKSKVPVALELAKDILSSPIGKLVMFAHHREVVQMLKNGLVEYGVDTIVGDDSLQKRADTMHKFQNSTLPRVLVISSAGGEGIDLYKADNLIMVERAWNPGKEEQIEGRLHRIGQVNPVVAWYLVARNTIDQRVQDLIENKRTLVGDLVGLPDIETLLLEEL